MYLSGAVFIDRKNRHDAVKAFNQVAKAMKDKMVSRRDMTMQHAQLDPDTGGHPAMPALIVGLS